MLYNISKVSFLYRNPFKGYLHHFYNVGYLHSPHNIIKENRYHFQIIQKQTTKTVIFFQEKQHSSSTRRHLFSIFSNALWRNDNHRENESIKNQRPRNVAPCIKWLKKQHFMYHIFMRIRFFRKKVPPLSLRSVWVVKVHALFIRTKTKKLKKVIETRAC